MASLPRGVLASIDSEDTKTLVPDATLLVPTQLGVRLFSRGSEIHPARPEQPEQVPLLPLRSAGAGTVVDRADHEHSVAPAEIAGERRDAVERTGLGAHHAGREHTAAEVAQRSVPICGEQRREGLEPGRSRE